MNKNFGVCCTVSQCKHNQGACVCDLDKIKVTCCSGDSCTCCESYEERV